MPVVDIVWALLGQVLLPLLVGAGVLIVSRRRPRLGADPFLTALGLSVALIFLTALASPGGDLWMPVIGGVVSVGVSIFVFLQLRRRKLEAARTANAP